MSVNTNQENVVLVFVPKRDELESPGPSNTLESQTTVERECYSFKEFTCVPALPRGRTVARRTDHGHNV